jgi:prevent-host-death family protein
MKVAVSEAKGQLTDLVRRAEAGEEIVLTRHGQPVVVLAPVHRTPSAESRRRAIDAARASAQRKARDGAGAARSQDFLYGDDGLPQ